MEVDDLEYQYFPCRNERPCSGCNDVLGLRVIHVLQCGECRERAPRIKLYSRAWRVIISRGSLERIERGY